MVGLRSPGLWLFLGGVEMILLVHIAEFLYPGYSVSQDYISRLGVGPADVKAVFMLALILFGAMGLVASYLLRNREPKSRIWLLLALAGIGSIGVAVFDMNSFQIEHAAFALMAFFFGNLSAIFSYRLVRYPLSWLFVILGVIGLVALGLFGSDTFLGIGQGGMERMIFYPAMLWAVGFGAYLIADEMRSPGQSKQI